MDVQRLAADLCLLVPFVTPLQNAVSYEQSNHSGAYAAEMEDVLRRFNAILEALSNVTGVPLPTNTTTDQEGDEEDTGHRDASMSPAVSGRNTRQVNDQNALPSPPPTVSVQQYI